MVALLSALLVGGAEAQPYAADGGFGRPQLLKTAPGQPLVATVALASPPLGGEATLVWADSKGVWSTEVGVDGTSRNRLTVASDAVRAVHAAYLGDELAIAWVERDRRTGVFEHQLLWRGEERTLFDDAVAVPLRMLLWQGRPYLAAALRREGEARVTLLPLDTANPELDEVVVHRTELAIRGLDLLVSGGELWLGWLEGETERTEVGPVSEWSALVALVTTAEAAVMVSAPVALGKADVQDERQAVALSSPRYADHSLTSLSKNSSAADVWALWPAEDGQLRISRVGATDGVLEIAFESDPLGAGRAIGASWPFAYLVVDSSVRRQDIRGLSGAPAADEALAVQPRNVLWSPVTIAGAAVSGADALRANGDRFSAVAWYGRVQGGEIEIYHSDDSAPMVRSWRDKLAAAMSWSPWHLVDEFIGQALTALLAGVLIAIAVTPVLLLLSPLIVRLLPSPRHAVLAGLLVGTVPLLLAGLVGALNLGYGSQAPLSATLEIVAAAALGVVGGWLATLRGDREAQGTVTLTGAITLFASFTVWTFLTYPNWAPTIGLA